MKPIRLGVIGARRGLSFARSAQNGESQGLELAGICDSRSIWGFSGGCGHLLRLINATQSLSKSSGGLPMAADPGPWIVRILPLRRSPPVRGLYHFTL